MLSWAETSTQGVGISFGPDVTKRWCELNSVSGVIRSHEVRQGGNARSFTFNDVLTVAVIDGYQVEHDGLCTTVSLLRLSGAHEHNNMPRCSPLRIMLIKPEIKALLYVHIRRFATQKLMKSITDPH